MRTISALIGVATAAMLLGTAAHAQPDAVRAEPAAGACISGPTPCVSVPIVWNRVDATPARGYSVTIELSAELTLCGVQAASAGYLAPGAAPPPIFEINPAGANRWVVDEVTLGMPCGATGTGTLFHLSVGTSGPLTGAGTIRVVSVLARDCVANAPIPAVAGADAIVTIDLVAPVAIADVAATRQAAGNDVDGTTRLAVTFTPPGDAASVEVWRRGFGGYPQYDENGGATPATPATPAAALAAGWTLTGVTASGQSDEPATRDVWHYVAFSTDGCGNVSAVSNASTGRPNYHLGDTHDAITACAGDNAVATPDVSFLGAHYATTLPVNDPLECLDVGPTVDFTPNTRPTTDNRLDFEDLIVLAISFGQVSAPPAALGPAREEDRAPRGSASAIAIEAPARVRAGETFEASVRLRGAGDVAGLALALGFDPAVAEPVAIRSGNLFEDAGGITLSPGPAALDGAVLGGRGLAGEGAVAIATFRARADGDPRIAITRAEARDGGNRPLALGTPVTPAPVAPPDAAPPSVTALAMPWPNPFRGSVTLDYALATAGEPTLAVYALDGRRVRLLAHGPHAAGPHRATWDARDDAGRPVAPGLYFARLTSAHARVTRTLAVLR